MKLDEVPENRRHRLFAVLGLRPPIIQLSEPEQDLLTRSAAGRHHAVELGVAEGGSARLIGEQLDKTATLDLIDPFFPGVLRVIGLHELIARRLMRSVRPVVRFHKMLSWEAPARCSFESVDLLFIDADHSEDAVRRDWKAWSPLLSHDARVLFHDSLDPVTGEPALSGPGVVLRDLLRRTWKMVDHAEALAAIERQRTTTETSMAVV